MTTAGNSPSTVRPDPEKVVKAIQRGSFCTLATVSPQNRPHSAGVLYAAVDTTLYVNTERTSRKARNVAHNPHVGVFVPVRRLPIGPPSSVQFQAVATILENDDPEIVRLVEQGRLRSVTSHGELDNPGGCFLRITPQRRATTYGLGMSLRQLVRDPLHAGGSVDLPD